MKAYDHIYLSPHFDDAALSCGGTIHRQCREGEAVLVITIGAAPPDPGQELSPFAQQIHGTMGNPADVVGTRLGEDKASMVCLGVEALWLDFPDALYRGGAEEGAWYYTQTSDIFGSIHPEEKNHYLSLADAVRDRVLWTENTVLYAPLGVGGHVDHQHTHRAARALQTEGWKIAFYEDYPYADPAFRLPLGEENTVTLEAVLALHKGTLGAHVSRFSEEDLLAKIESVRAYVTQVPMLFGDDETMASRLRHYALHIGQEGPAERFWVRKQGKALR